MRPPTRRPGSGRPSLTSLTHIVALVAIVALIGIPLFSSSLAATSRQWLGVGSAPTPTVAGDSNRMLSKRESSQTSDSLFTSNFAPSGSFSLMMPQDPPSETIETFASDCTTPKTDFDLGETVCAKISGAPLPVDGRAQRRIGWVSPYGSLAQGADITMDPQNGTYLIPTSQTQTFTDDGGGTVVVDNRGTWSVNTFVTAGGSRRTSAYFTVHDPATPYVDLSVGQSVSETNSRVTAGSTSVFSIIVSNRGPDAANVFLGDVVPANTTFVSFVQKPGLPIFTCTTPPVGETGGINCQTAIMNRGDSVSFDFAYQVDPGTPTGTVISNFVNLDSGVAEIQPNDNSSTAYAQVTSTGGSSACTLECSDNINANANTEQGGQRGAHITFEAAAASGPCGAITASPASGSFFAVGTTIVSVTSETGGGSCSFSVTIEDQGNQATISCPPNKEANAGSTCNATVVVGNPTTTGGTHVTVTGARSDGEPMYDCDMDNVCTRKSTDLPFTVGTTTITWTAYSHNTPGPYATTEDEEAARTGSASCTQTVTVTDTTAPAITCPANITTGTDPGTCSATVDPGVPTTTDNCEPTITGVRSDGEEVNAPYPLGTTTITWTASDDAGSASCTQTVTVNDSEDPTVTAPADSSATGNASCQAPVPDYAASSTAADNCGNPTVTQSPAAGTIVGAGPHTVTVTATDGAGRSSSDTVVFTVIDDTDPTVTAPADSSASANATCQAAVPNYAAASTAADNCDTSVTVTQIPAAGTLVGQGSHTVTVTATDDAGNSSSDTVVFTVNDNTAPVITCPANVTSCSPIVNPGTATATDNCDSSPTVSGTRSDGLPLNAPYPNGPTTITWTATDDNLNQSSCTQTVSVTSAATALGPANIWVGVKTSDSVGLRFDLKAEVYKNDTLLGSGEVFNVPGGSSGFNNAILRTIAIAQSQGGNFCPGDQLKFKLWVRAGSTGHVSGYSRLWYDDAQANSRFDTSIDGNTNSYYLLNGFVTGTAPGPGPKKTIDVFVHRNQNGNAYKTFGTWVKTF